MSSYLIDGLQSRINLANTISKYYTFLHTFAAFYNILRVHFITLRALSCLYFSAKGWHKKAKEKINQHKNPKFCFSKTCSNLGYSQHIFLDLIVLNRRLLLNTSILKNIPSWLINTRTISFRLTGLFSHIFLQAEFYYEYYK